ncbi:ISL3 family transposase [Halosquirtibacter laminarini]|uniref:ISL3 family transposase n=1 Tax=Halosquirtibacter laminarini TaxID=3374600 RepID=A0AC61NNN7_9BACT|nr:ISL3 family transposase [Prolixibacteraceae bacterium]
MNLSSYLFTAALHIESPFYIDYLDFDTANKRLDVHVSFTRGSKFSYDGECDLSVHDTREKRSQHLNFFENECFIIAKVSRVITRSDRVVTLPMSWEGTVSGFTLLFEALLLPLLSNMPVHKVSKLTGIYVDKSRSTEDFTDLEVVGIDETSCKKGHNYVTLFVDLKERRTVHVSEGKGSDTIASFCEIIPHKKEEDMPIESDCIKQVSCDMSPSFISGVQKHLPKSSITFDKFHIMKLINEAVDSVRRTECKEEECLKGHRYLFLSNQDNYTKKQEESFNDLKISHSKLKSFRALRIRESFQDIYSYANTIEEFECLLKQWYYWATHSRLEPNKKVAKTIKNHWNGIVKWMDTKLNNGILEGLNSIVQSAKRRARGFRKTENFITMIYLITGKLDFRKINKHYRSF